MKTSSYIEAVLSCPTEHQDLVNYYLFERGALGSEELSEQNNQIQLRIFFAQLSKEEFLLSLQEIGHQLQLSSEDLSLIRFEIKPTRNWQEEWQQYFKPIQIGQYLEVLPPWETPTPDRKPVVIQPGMAFGTGYHESTKMALEQLEFLSTQTSLQDVLDVGIGSGILSIAALHLGANKIIGYEIDEDALQEVPKNVTDSGLSTSMIELHTGSPEGANLSSHLVVANIIAQVLLDLQPSLIQMTKPNGYLLLSGIFHDRYEEVFSSYSKEMQLINHLQQGEWNSLLFSKKA